MNCLIPLVLLCLTTFFVLRSNPDRLAGAQQQAALKAGADPSLELRREPPATGTFTGPAGAAVHHAANGASGPSWPGDAEKETMPVRGSEAEAEVIESAGILNRLELFEF